MKKIGQASVLVFTAIMLSNFFITPVLAFFPKKSVCKFETPTNGNLNLGDDSYKDVSNLLPPGSSFTFFGKEYGPGNPGIFVGTNGYITFGEGDSDFSESFEDLCRIPRISALFDDFNPATGGAIKGEFQSFPPRLIVTWDEVPEFGTTNSNTFQIILYLATNRYQVSYHGVDAIDGLVGVCSGFPTPPKDINSGHIVLGNKMNVLYEEFNGGSPFDLDDQCIVGVPVLKENSTPIFIK